MHSHFSTGYRNSIGSSKIWMIKQNIFKKISKIFNFMCLPNFHHKHHKTLLLEQHLLHTLDNKPFFKDFSKKKKIILEWIWKKKMHWWLFEGSQMYIVNVTSSFVQIDTKTGKFYSITFRFTLEKGKEKRK